MWLNRKETYRRDEPSWRGDIPGLAHPREAFPGDFNGDGGFDTFVARHGYDHPSVRGVPATVSTLHHRFERRDP